MPTAPPPAPMLVPADIDDAEQPRRRSGSTCSTARSSRAFGAEGRARVVRSFPGRRRRTSATRWQRALSSGSSRGTQRGRGARPAPMTTGARRRVPWRVQAFVVSPETRLLSVRLVNQRGVVATRGVVEAPPSSREPCAPRGARPDGSLQRSTWRATRALTRAPRPRRSPLLHGPARRPDVALAPAAPSLRAARGRDGRGRAARAGGREADALFDGDRRRAGRTRRAVAAYVTREVGEGSATGSKRFDGEGARHAPDGRARSRRDRRAPRSSACATSPLRRASDDLFRPVTWARARGLGYDRESLDTDEGHAYLATSPRDGRLRASTVDNSHAALHDRIVTTLARRSNARPTARETHRRSLPRGTSPPWSAPSGTRAAHRGGPSRALAGMVRGYRASASRTGPSGYLAQSVNGAAGRSSRGLGDGPAAYFLLRRRRSRAQSLPGPSRAPGTWEPAGFGAVRGVRAGAEGRATSTRGRRCRRAGVGHGFARRRPAVRIDRADRHRAPTAIAVALRRPSRAAGVALRDGGPPGNAIPCWKRLTARRSRESERRPDALCPAIAVLLVAAHEIPSRVCDWLAHRADARPGGSPAPRPLATVSPSPRCARVARAAGPVARPGPEAGGRGAPPAPPEFRRRRPDRPSAPRYRPRAMHFRRDSPSWGRRSPLCTEPTRTRFTEDAGPVVRTTAGPTGDACAPGRFYCEGSSVAFTCDEHGQVASRVTARQRDDPREGPVPRLRPERGAAQPGQQPPDAAAAGWTAWLRTARSCKAPGRGVSVAGNRTDRCSDSSLPALKPAQLLADGDAQQPARPDVPASPSCWLTCRRTRCG